MALTKVHFKLNNYLYCQLDGLASLTVLLANIGMKSTDYKRKKESCVLDPELKKDPSEKSSDCSKKLVWNSKTVDCE